MTHPTKHPATRARTARRTHRFTESVIREMTRVASECGAINLAQGFPDFPAPEVLKEAASAAIRADVNQYAVTWGAPRLRRAVAAKYARFYGIEVDEAREVTIACGATEAMASTLLAIVDPGDEVVIFEPFYENYGPDAILCGATPVWVPLPEGGDGADAGADHGTGADARGGARPAADAEPGGAEVAGARHAAGTAAGLDLERLAAAFSARTRAIVLNSPNNPTGRVFSREELEAIAELCRRHDVVAVTDEIYEHILYEGEHIPLATLDGMRERTVTISGYSKTFSITGWRIGTIVAPPDITSAIRKVHDFLTVGAPAPLQEACAVALEALGDDYYAELARDYRARRDALHPALREAGFRCAPPAGAYYILADFSALDDRDDDTFARWLAREVGVAPVPGSSFFHRPEDGRHLVRFAFCKTLATLEEAARRLRSL